MFWNWVVGMIGIIIGACIFATEFEDATFFTRFIFKLIAILLLVFSVAFIKWRRKKYNSIIIHSAPSFFDMFSSYH